jgi:lactoylglutathione lyase
MRTFDHVAFQTGNLDRAIDFYVSRLGFDLLSRNMNIEEQEEYAFLALGDTRLELIQSLRHPFTGLPPEPPYCPHFAIETSDMDAAVRRLKQVNVEILRGPLRIEGEATWVYFADLDNNVLEYVQWLKGK